MPVPPWHAVAREHRHTHTELWKYGVLCVKPILESHLPSLLQCCLQALNQPPKECPALLFHLRTPRVCRLRHPYSCLALGRRQVSAGRATSWMCAGTMVPRASFIPMWFKEFTQLLIVHAAIRQAVLGCQLSARQYAPSRDTDGAQACMLPVLRGLRVQSRNRAYSITTQGTGAQPLCPVLQGGGPCHEGAE